MSVLFQIAFSELFLIESGIHLLSHAVSSIVSSASQVLTIVFGMGTGVSPGRIATGKFCYQVFSFFFVHAPIDELSAMLLMDSLTTGQQSNPYFFLRKEVIQPHLPIRLPCYDFTPVIESAFDGSSPLLSTIQTSATFHCVLTP